MSDGPALPPLRQVIARHGLAALKSLGQHFLLDGNITARIARAAGDLSGCSVIEVGPGPGGLTRALLAAGAREVVAVEVDRRAIAALAELSDAFPGRLRIVEADAMIVDPATLAAAPRKIVANLPYNIGTRLLVDWMPRAEAYAGLVLMFQREVADRLVAPPGGKDYGRVSVLVQWRCAARRLFDLPAAAFVPPPKVASSVVELRPHGNAVEPALWEAMSRVTAAAFGQRRKMLRASLRPLWPDPIPILEAAAIQPSARAETIDVAGFVRLAEAWLAGTGRRP